MSKRNSLRVLVTILVLMLSMMSLIAVNAQDDEAEEDEAPGFSVPILMDGDSLEAEFEGDVTAKLFAFNATEGDEVTITVEAADEDILVDPYVIVLGAAGQVIGYDDDGGDGLNSMLEIEIPADGGYFIVATTFGGRSFSTEVEDAEPYIVTVEGNTQPEDLEDFDEDVVQFFRSELVYGEEFTDGYSNLAEPVYYFVFDGEEGDVLNFTTESEDLDTLLYIFDPMGNRIYVNNDMDGSNAGAEEFELPETGRYLIFVTRADFWTASLWEDEEDFPLGLFSVLIEEVE